MLAVPCPQHDSDSPPMMIICLVVHFYILLLYCTLSRKGGTEGGGLGHPQGAVHMVAAGLGCKWVAVGTELANSHPVCMNGLRKRYSHLVGAHFWQGAVRMVAAWLGCKRGNGWHRVGQFSPWLHEQRGEPGRKAALVTCVVSSCQRSWRSINYVHVQVKYYYQIGPSMIRWHYVDLFWLKSARRCWTADLPASTNLDVMER